jgi:putative acetyltransferase
VSDRVGSMIEIKAERPEHMPLIRELLCTAFPTSDEADLVNELRDAGALTISLVAIDQGTVIGHIAFSPVTIDPGRHPISLLGLAPLAVAPSAQGRGLGSKLVDEGLRACSQAGCDGVVVLGAPDFYQRFGFRSASERRLRCLFDAPAEAFMIAELNHDVVRFSEGTVRFHPAFDRFLPPGSSTEHV